MKVDIRRQYKEIVREEHLSKEALKQPIDDYYEIFKKIPYLIMNRDTFNNFRVTDTTINKQEGSSYFSFYGCPIAISEKPKYGEVELR